MSESVRAQQRRKNNMKVIPASADRIEKREKHNKYILATRGPLSRFAGTLPFCGYATILRVKTLSLQEPGSGQIQCTSRRDHTPFTTSTFIHIHASVQAWGNRGGSAVGAKYIVRGRKTRHKLY